MTASRRGTVLVVDDSELVLESARLTLEAAAFHVVTLQSPLALALVAGQVKPDVVLLDVAMPALRGDVAIGIARSHHLLEDACVLLHSARDPAELEELRVRSGAAAASRRPTIPTASSPR